MITWRMEVKDETFTNLRDHPSVGQDYITPNDGVASLDSFSVDGAGNCLEAQFTASPKFVDIRPRDIVSLEVSEDNGSTWTPVYRGYVVTAGNPRSDDIQSYKLVGLRQRFFEITNTIVNVLEQDVASQASDVFAHLNTEGDWPAGVVNSVPTIPSTGFVNGIVHPAKESYGDTFKQIADAAGRFVVNLGDSYTYDGVTYNEGDTVLGVRFGVDASGNAFFRRPQGNAVTYAEGDDGIVANYVQVTGEEIFDNIELVYADSYKGFPSGIEKAILYRRVDSSSTALNSITLPLEDGEAIPLSRTFSFGPNESVRQIKLESPSAFMSSNPFVFDTDVDVTNPSGAFSGGSTQFGSFGSKANYRYTCTLQDGFILKFAVRTTGSSSIERGRFRVLAGIGFLTDDTGVFKPVIQSFMGDKINASYQEFTFSCLPASNFFADTSRFGDITPFTFLPCEVEFSGENFEIKDLQMLVPDVDQGGTKSEQFASGFVRDVQQNVAEVKRFGELGQVADRVNWTPSGESQVTVPVERIQYTLTTRDGLVTTYELGQAYDAEALSQRKVLKDLAREAVSE